MKMLVSVRTVAEALLAAGGGADFIDLKEPRDGALGGLPVATIAAVVAALRGEGSELPLRGQGSRLPVSATIGDLPAHDLAAILARVDAVAACGVDYVKVGVERAPAAAALIQALATCPHAVVPVFIADRGLDFERVDQACAAGFPALMVDTADKLAGSLFDVMAEAELQRFLAAVRACGKLAGLAGALRLPHLPVLRALAPDFAGFRSAVCVGGRGEALDGQRLSDLSAALHGPAAAA
ncbi:(5-formylfuran-3-yl)methyl phosphate synthase [Rubrivivax sp. A210]|uniref:(5-formylfuran-3-yl)methyl phosphate synthase n=1 Tax=Rubrivivax sp. A210 TaxID=2772301 RepID=UPI001F37A61D|nr:(5-formylfuran-3-yl)methyl phosphate synthase [Rubrivivax sp. A210]